jgi:hypothetical protein
MGDGCRQVVSFIEPNDPYDFGKGSIGPAARS